MTSVLEAVLDGDRLKVLVAIRDRLAAAISDESCPKRDLASLTLRLTKVMDEIESAKSAEGGDDIGRAVSTPDAEFDPETL